MYCKTIGCCLGISRKRWNIGMRLCMICADKRAKQVKHTIVPMPKSNYIVVTDRSLLVGLNSSHKGVK